MHTRVIKAVITGGLQTLAYSLLIYLGWTVGTMIHEPTRMTIAEAVGFGALIKISIMVFGTMMLLMNLIDSVVNHGKWKWRLVIIVTVVYVVYWGQTIDYIPYKTTLFLIAGVISIFSKFAFEKLINFLPDITGRGSDLEKQ